LTLVVFVLSIVQAAALPGSTVGTRLMVVATSAARAF